MYRQSEKIVKQQYVLHISPQYGELRPIYGWDLLASLGHTSKFQRVSRVGFVTAGTSLTGGQPNFARCLAVSWAATLHIHFRGLLLPDRILPGAKFTTSKSCILVSYIGTVTARHSALLQRASAKLCGVVQGMELPHFRRKRHLYSAGRPSRWASAHILVWFKFYSVIDVCLCQLRCRENALENSWSAKCVRNLISWKETFSVWHTFRLTSRWWTGLNCWRKWRN